MATQADDWGRFRRAIADEPLPAALVDLDAFDANVEKLLAPVRASGKTVRIATKSIRCLSLIQRVAGKEGVQGLMTYSAAESAFLVENGARDLILAYPTVQPADARLLAQLNQRARCAVVVDSAEHLPPLADAARDASASIPVIIELDVSLRTLGMHLGVRRSPVRDAATVVELARKIADTRGLEFAGIMGYEAQIAGLTDAGPFAAWQNPFKRMIKRRSRPSVQKSRHDVVQALRENHLPPSIVNGGGTGSVGWSSLEPALTEITIGSGFLVGHLFDYYVDLHLDPALFFALQTVRRPAPGLVTCHLGGYIASGAIAVDRLPLPWLPRGCQLLPMEGAGEVQTPVALPDGVDVPLGGPLFFRPAKSGELAERFNHYLLLSGDRIAERAPTYRGQGRAFG
jgi:D-serine deaminase-like pyridoxal phosphate-dependent protein